MRAGFFFAGYARLGCNASCRTEFLDLCFSLGIPYCEFAVDESGRLSLTVTRHAARRLLPLCEARGIGIEVLGEGGLFHLFYRRRRRAGLWIGSLLALLLLVLSTRFVWDVRVRGNETLEQGEVEAVLSACGFGVGSYIPAVKTEVLETRVTLVSDRIAWISVVLDGTVARVQILENHPAPEEPAVTRPANLVATADGQIESIELLRGNCLVHVGQAVRRGELLVSGLYDSQTVGYRYTRAAGRVIARTEREISVRIPHVTLQRDYGEEKILEIEVIFFGFSIKIYKSTGNLPTTCDIIKTETVPEPLGLSDLPLSWRVTRARPYVEREVTLTPEEALGLAEAELEGELSSLSRDATLLQKEITVQESPDATVLLCRATVLCDIARQVEFEISGERPG